MMDLIHQRDRDSFQFQPLETPRTIRVATVLQSQPGDGIVCTIKHVSLDGPLDYEAISYDEGDVDQDMTSISIRVVDTAHGGNGSSTHDNNTTPSIDSNSNSSIDSGNATPPTPTSKTEHSHKELRVTVTQHATIKRLRFPHYDRPIWIDVLCVNQDDPDEKTTQVRLLPDIYAGAIHAIAWLGPGLAPGVTPGPGPGANRGQGQGGGGGGGNNDADGSRGALRAIERVQRTLYVDPSDHDVTLEEQERRQTARLTLERDWQPLHQVVRSPWFRRCWSMQEVMHPRVVVVFYGANAALGWPTLGDALKLLLRTPGAASAGGADVARNTVNGYKLDLLLRRGINFENIPLGPRESLSTDDNADAAAAAAAANMAAQAARDTRAACHLYDVWDMARGYVCTDPRDYINSLWGTAVATGGDRDMLLPDYRQTPVELFTRFADLCLVTAQGQRTDILSFAGTSSSSSSERTVTAGLPSWVPDFSRIGKTYHTLTSQHPFEARFSAGGTHVSGSLAVVDNDGNEVSVDDAGGDGRLLRCSNVKMVDVVDGDKLIYRMADEPLPEYQPTWPQIHGMSHQDRRRSQRFMDWIHACERLTAAEQGSEITTNTSTRVRSEWYEQFWRTIMCEILAGDPQDIRIALGNNETFRTYHTVTEHFLARGGNLNDPGMAIVVYRMCRELVEMTLDNYAGKMRFCVTKEGRLGQMPQGVREGDEICVIRGFQVPFVVRKVPSTDRKYELIGECYVNGVMDGETLDGEGYFQQILLQ